MKGPALFLGQFAGDGAPFNSWKSITAWAADCGYLVGVQVPSWENGACAGAPLVSIEILRRSPAPASCPQTFQILEAENTDNTKS